MFRKAPKNVSKMITIYRSLRFTFAASEVDKLRT